MVENLVNVSRSSYNKAKKKPQDDGLYIDLADDSSPDPLSKLKTPPPFSPAANKRPIKKTSSPIPPSSKNKPTNRKSSDLNNADTTKTDKNNVKYHAPVPLSNGTKQEKENQTKKDKSSNNSDKTNKKSIKRVETFEDEENAEDDQIKELEHSKAKITKKIKRIE